jgi:hypothetical protein
MDNKLNFSREVKLQWAGSRERFSASGRGGAFFLTSLFIELIDRIVSVKACFVNYVWPGVSLYVAEREPGNMSRARN